MRITLVCSIVCCWICVAICQASSQCLSDAVPKSARRVDVVGGNPVLLAQYSWESSRIVGDIARILLEERLGLSVNLSAVLGGSHLGPPALAGGFGCIEDDGFSGCNIQEPLAHFVFDAWGGGEKSYLLMNRSIQPQMGDMGYTGFEGTFVPDSAVQLGLSRFPRAFLDFYKSYDAEDINLTHFLASKSEVQAKISELGLRKASCVRAEIPQAFAGCEYYEAATSDLGLYTRTDGECHLTCQDDWIESPACRSNPSSCVAWVTTGDGWGVEEMLQQAVFWNIPLAVVVLPEWGDYTTLPLEVPSLWFWFFPDPSFMAINPMKLQEPPTDSGERASRIFRTGADRIVLRKFSWQLLATFAPQVQAFIDNVQFSQNDITMLMQNASLGQDLHDIACQWVRDNEERWDNWLPLPDACAAGWEFNLEENRCTRCLPGTFSLGVGSSSPTCEDCHSGKFGIAVGLSTCASCLVGHFSVGVAQTECQRCPSGTYADAEGRTQCQWCSSGKEQQLWNTLRKVTDVAGNEQWVQIDGASSADDCGCNFGARWADGSNGTQCVVCDTEGMDCIGRGEIRVKSGYMSDIPVFIFKCFGNSKRCVGGIPGQTCSEGRTGVACSGCERGKRAGDNGRCETCAGSDVVPAFVLVVAMLFILVGVYHIVDSTVKLTVAPSHSLIMGSIALGQLVGVLQQMSVVAYFNVNYEEPLESFIQFFALLAFDYEILNLSCFHTFSAVLRYSIKILCFVVCGVLVCFLHCCYVIICYRGRFKERMPALTSALRMIMLGIFTSLVVIVLGPFQCNKHPNGKFTMVAYEDAICWTGGQTEQGGMIAIAAMTLCAPLSFYTHVCYLAFVFPRRMKELDGSFVKSYGTLFMRFRSGRHWYIMAVLTRSMLIALIPIIRAPVLQIFILQIILLVSLSLCYIVKPWRVPRLNYLDAFLTLVLVSIANLAAFVVDDVDTRGIGYFVACMLAVALSTAPIIMFVAVCKKIAGSVRKPFQFFICHAKAQAGSFARLLKLHLVDCTQVRREVFLDADNLDDLDKLLSYVTHDVETLVVLLSQATLFRPWCVGEVSVAYTKGVPTASVDMPGYESGWLLSQRRKSSQVGRASQAEMVSTEIADCLAKCRGVQALAEAGLDTDLIMEALAAIDRADKLTLPQTIIARHIEVLAQNIADGRRKGQLELEAGDVVESLKEPEVLLIADGSTSEAVAAAGVVKKLLGEKLVSRATDVVFGVDVMEGDTVPERTQVAILICTDGCLLLRHVIRALLECANRELQVLPIVCEEHFRYPSLALFATLNEDILPESEDGLKRSLEDVNQQILTLCEDAFKEIAVKLPMGASSLKMLHVAIDEAVNRIARAKVHKMRAKSAQRSFARKSMVGASARGMFQPEEARYSIAVTGSSSPSQSPRSCDGSPRSPVSKLEATLERSGEEKDESDPWVELEIDDAQSPRSICPPPNVERRFSFDC